MIPAAILSTFILFSWSQEVPLCTPPNDNPILCPGKYMPQPGPPTAAERKWVEEAIKSVSTARNAERDAIDILKKNIADASEDADKLEVARQAYRDLKALTAAKYAACEEAIRRAVIAYNLTPPMLDLSEPSGRAPGTYHAVSWRPRYSEKEIWDPTTRFYRARTGSEINAEAAGNRIKIGGRVLSGGAARAKTHPDGGIAVFQSAFFRDADPGNKKPDPDPERLALSIMHETSHWVMAGGLGGFKESDSPSLTFLGEYEAYEAEAEFARKLGRDDSHQKLLADQFHRQMVAGEKLTSRDQVRSQHPDWLVPGPRRGLAPENENRAGEPDRPEYLKLEGELEMLEAARDAKLLQERLRQELEARRRREREAAEETERQGREMQQWLEKTALAYGFQFEEWKREGSYLWLIFFETPLKAPYHRYRFPVRKWEEAEVALFLTRSCLDGRVAKPSEEPLETLRGRIGDPEFRKRITPVYGMNKVPDCFDLLLMNPDFLLDEAGIQEVIDANIERTRKAEEWERASRGRGGGTAGPAPRKDRGEKERDRGGVDLSPADRAVDRARRVRLP